MKRTLEYRTAMRQQREVAYRDLAVRLAPSA